MKYAILLIFLASISWAALPDIITDPSTRDTVEYLDAKINQIDTRTLVDTTAYSKTANGYSYLPGGVIIQWGRYVGGVNSPTITFPKVFPNAVFSLSCQIEVVAGTNGAMVEVVNSVTTSGFVGNQRRHDAAALTNNFWWIAIGY